jgi:hypothetical protein
MEWGKGRGMEWEGNEVMIRYQKGEGSDGRQDEFVAPPEVQHVVTETQQQHETYGSESGVVFRKGLSVYLEALEHLKQDDKDQEHCPRHQP